MNGLDAAVACGLKADGARLAVTFAKTEFDAVKNAIGYQTSDSGSGKIWMGEIISSGINSYQNVLFYIV